MVIVGLLLGLVLAACGGGVASAGVASPSVSGSSPAVSAAAGTGQPSAAVANAPAVGASSAAAGGGITLKIAHVPSTLFSPLYVAIDKGYLRQQGITADLTVVAAGQDAMAFLANGQLDAAVAGMSAGTFNAINQGLEVRIVSSMGAAPQQGDPSALFVRTDELGSAIKSAADLKGKKIGLTGGLGATGSYYMAQILAKANLSLSDVDVLNLGFADMVTGFKNKSIDAAIPSAPFTTQISNDKSAAIPDYGHLTPGVSGVGTIYGAHLLKQDPSFGKKLMTALVMGARDVQGDNARSADNIRILAKYTKLPVDTLQTMALYDFKPDLAPDSQTYQNMQQSFIQAGILKFPQPLPADKVVDDSFTKAAAAAAK